MKKESKQTKKFSGLGGMEKGVLVGVGIAAIAATAAGTYFLYGSKEASKHRKQVKSWMFKARAEVMDKLESLKHVNKNTYYKIVKEVANRYKTLKQIDMGEMNDFVTELKTHWGNIKKEIDTITSTGVPVRKTSAVKKNVIKG